MVAPKNVVVVGGSYVGLAAVKELIGVLPKTHRVLLIEPHSHFHHLFAFPRFAVTPGYEHKAFIPYKGAFASAQDPSQHQVIKAKVTSLKNNRVILDRAWQGSQEVPFDYVVVTTGTKLAAPGTMQSDEKSQAVTYLQGHQQGIQQAGSIAIIGGGAVGVQMATDLKELYPSKEITLIHSRQKLMPLYHERMSDIIKERFEELGVRLIAGTRVKLPEGGFPNNGTPFEVELVDGRTVAADFAIVATGQSPNNQFLDGLEPSPETSLVNPQNGFINVLPTLQFRDPKYPNFFAAGDIADSGAHKAARPGMGQAEVVAKNIIAMMQGASPENTITVTPPAIHLTLGLTKNMIFRNPDTSKGHTEPTVNMKDDGSEDMSIDGVWERRGVRAESARDYHL